MLHGCIFSRAIVYSPIYWRLNRDALDLLCWHLSICTQQKSKPGSMLVKVYERVFFIASNVTDPTVSTFLPVSQIGMNLYKLFLFSRN